MNFDRYQQKSREFAVYPDLDKNYIYPLLGLVGESGEVVEKIKKVIRDNDGLINEEKLKEIAAELGDVLWYLAQLCVELGVNLDDVAKWNLEKLASRASRGTLHGSGDHR